VNPRPLHDRNNEHLRGDCGFQYSRLPRVNNAGFTQSLASSGFADPQAMKRNIALPRRHRGCCFFVRRTNRGPRYGQ
jgi:hypothetical protein